jgi:hypothetical protein
VNEKGDEKGSKLNFASMSLQEKLKKETLRVVVITQGIDHK